MYSVVSWVLACGSGQGQDSGVGRRWMIEFELSATNFVALALALEVLWGRSIIRFNGK